VTTTLMKSVCLALAALLIANAGAADLSSVTKTDAAAALRTALTQGATKAVQNLGRADGFFGNPQVKIPLPPTLRKTEKTLRRFGFGDTADQLVLTMNRAAESAVPEAKTLLIDAVKSMTIDDARGILSGGEDAATQYFRRKTEAALAAKFKPVVARETQKVGVTKNYNSLAGKAAQFGLIDATNANLDDYVTGQALDGLFKMIAQEELAIRKDPLGQSSRLLQTVFGIVAPKK
jgi:hypothetical protein